MNMTMRQKHREIFYSCLLFFFMGPVIFASASKNQESICGQVLVDDCLRKVEKFLSLTPLPFTLDKVELDELCSNAKGGYNCSSYLLATSGCLVDRDADIFEKFKNMMEHNRFLTDSCSTVGQTRTKREYHEEFDPNDLSFLSKCPEKGKESVKCCIESTKVLEISSQMQAHPSIESLKSICCAAANAVKCMVSVLRINCGDDEAESVVHYFQHSMKEVKSICKMMVEVDIEQPDQKLCTAPIPVCAGSRIGTFVEFTVLMSLLFVICINYLSYFIKSGN